MQDFILKSSKVACGNLQSICFLGAQGRCLQKKQRHPNPSSNLVDAYLEEFNTSQSSSYTFEEMSPSRVKTILVREFK